MRAFIPVVKNSLFRSSSTLGLHLGSGWSVARINLIAEDDICDEGGILYSHLFIREYVSFSELVSNGGFPINRVYLQNKVSYYRENFYVSFQHHMMSGEEICSQQSRLTGGKKGFFFFHFHVHRWIE
jgi:hypothetical protein